VEAWRRGPTKFKLNKKRLKTLKRLTPYKFIVSSWKNNPTIFKINPNSGTISQGFRERQNVTVKA
jgi:hypothetical protein